MPEVFNLSPNLISKFKIILLTSNARMTLVSVKDNQNKELKFWINSRGHEIKVFSKRYFLQLFFSQEFPKFPHTKKGKADSDREGMVFQTYHAPEEGQVLKCNPLLTDAPEKMHECVRGFLHRSSL